jgi:NAD(P)H-hydrate epimerase
MREVDRAMVDDVGIVLLQMMENAGRALARVGARRFLDGDPRGRRVVVLAGTGGNGGGALVAARRLRGWGAEVVVGLTRGADAYRSVPRHQLAILERLGIDLRGPERLDEIGAVDLILDGVIGYSLRGAPRGGAAALIGWCGRRAEPILSLDTPSGLDTASGVAHDPTVVASATLTLALPKLGLDAHEARQHVGELYLADIGVPPEVYAGPSLDLDVGPIFAHDDVVRIR